MDRTAVRHALAPLTVTTLLAGTALVVGCGDSGSPSGADGVVVTDSAGVRIVENTGSGAWGPDEAWDVEEIFRVGGLDADDDARFGMVMSVDVGDDGRVYVADRQARQVSVYGPDGTLVSRFGQAGEGPGELGPMFMGMFERDGEVWTIDPGAQGIQRFDEGGEFLGASAFNIMGGIPIRMDEVADGVVAQRRAMGLDGSMGESGDAITRIGTDTADTLTVLPAGETVRVDNGQPSVVMFAPEPVWDFATDGSSVQGMMHRYRLEIRDAAGNLERIVARDVDAQPVTERVEATVVERLRDQMASMGAPEEMLETVLQQMQFAESLPVMAQVILDDDGSLWVQRTADVTSLDEDEPMDLEDLGAPRWDVFDAEGVYLGEVELPGRFQPLRMIDGVLWGVDLDEFDVQSVVGLRVVR